MASTSSFSTPTIGTPRQGAVGADTSTPVPNGALLSPATAVVCVFCGASPGKAEVHMEAARALAKLFHESNTFLVYGGGTSGIMGEVARTLVSLSGPTSVHGIIPEALQRYEQEGKGIDEQLYGKTTIVKDMHTRKQMMAKEVIAGGPGSGFVALSGGFGTMEELMEVTTWNQLGIHDKPVVVYNVDGYYDGLMLWVKSAVKAGFIAQANQSILVEAKTADETMDCLRNYELSKARFDLAWDSEG